MANCDQRNSSVPVDNKGHELGDHYKKDDLLGWWWEDGVS